MSSVLLYLRTSPRGALHYPLPHSLLSLEFQRLACRPALYSLSLLCMQSPQRPGLRVLCLFFLSEYSLCLHVSHSWVLSESHKKGLWVPSCLPSSSPIVTQSMLRHLLCVPHLQNFNSNTWFSEAILPVKTKLSCGDTSKFTVCIVHHFQYVHPTLFIYPFYCLTFHHSYFLLSSHPQNPNFPFS